MKRMLAGILVLMAVAAVGLAAWPQTWHSVVARKRAGGAPASPLVLWYEYDGALTNGAGVVVDSSDAGNNGTPGAGAALPTWSVATNGMTNIVTYDGGDSITSTVTAGQSTIMYWATSGGVWRSYIKTGAAEYVNGVTQAFDETYFYDLTANVFTWGSGFTGDMTLQRVWDTAQTDFNGMHWTQAVNVGYSQWDHDNRSDWSNTVYVGTFSYDSPADTSPEGNHGTKGAAAAAPTHDGDAINGWYDFDGGDHVSIAHDVGLEPSNITVACWAKSASWGTADAVSKWYSGDAGNQSWLLISVTGAIRFYISDGAADFVQGPALPTATWIHLAATYNGTDAILYTNGVAAATNAIGKVMQSSSGADPFIGARDGVVGTYFTGQIDEVRIYDTALPAGTVSDLHNDTKYLFGL